jgi:hypothetical protein
MPRLAGTLNSDEFGAKAQGSESPAGPPTSGAPDTPTTAAQCGSWRMRPGTPSALKIQVRPHGSGLPVGGSSRLQRSG